jgi:hypothetical protein
VNKHSFLDINFYIEEVDKLTQQAIGSQAKFTELKRIADQTLLTAEENEQKLVETEVNSIKVLSKYYF